MNSRYLTNIALAVMGGFVVVVSQAWSVPVFMWIMFAAGVLAILLAGSALLPRRGLAQRVLDGIIAVLGAWTVVASLVFAGSTVTWLGFASGVAFVGLALLGLTLHELRTERVVHSFQVTPASEQYAQIG
ncbi:MAG TPA: hypothetical protein VKV27_01480 [Solirubrobacteraceae bacterium]|nr:hypothetical protein [Solirubrobacteraceae bacterium]